MVIYNVNMSRYEEFDRWDHNIISQELKSNQRIVSQLSELLDFWSFCKNECVQYIMNKKLEDDILWETLLLDPDDFESWKNKKIEVGDNSYEQLRFSQFHVVEYVTEKYPDAVKQLKEKDQLLNHRRFLLWHTDLTLNNPFVEIDSLEDIGSYLVDRKNDLSPTVNKIHDFFNIITVSHLVDQNIINILYKLYRQKKIWRDIYDVLANNIESEIKIIEQRLNSFDTDIRELIEATRSTAQKIWPIRFHQNEYKKIIKAIILRERWIPRFYDRILKYYNRIVLEDLEKYISWDIKYIVDQLYDDPDWCGPQSLWLLSDKEFASLALLDCLDKEFKNLQIKTNTYFAR